MATIDETQETYAGPGPTSGPSPPPESPGAGVPSDPLLGYDPTKPVMSGPLQPQDITGTSHEEEATRAYGEDSLAVRAAKTGQREKNAGKGLLFSDIGERAAIGAGFDKAMELVAPDVKFKQDQVKSAEDFKQQTSRDEQLNKYDVATQKRMQWFNVNNEKLRHKFTKELSEMNFGQDMEKALLTTMQGMITAGNTMLTQLAMSGEATPKEVEKIQESIRNSLTTYSNIWKGSANSKDTFDFSTIA